MLKLLRARVWAEVCAGMFTLFIISSCPLPVCVSLVYTIHNAVRLHMRGTTSLKVISAHTRWSQQAPPSALTPLIDW